ncbi:acetate--CoA ligase [Vampirovibrio sp.]|uniref:acetate--CoA ligase n=1 Tax=Vampirovibrio sp. TaxID=2717857 RepID=UPI003593FBF9
MPASDDHSFHYPVIHKDKGAQSPNMQDYDQLYQSFQWDDWAKSNLNLPRKNGVNKATVCIDGHAPEVMLRKALIWQATHGQQETYTFEDLKRQTNRFANVLTSLGIQKGDRVFVYLERIPEIFITLFGALKTGAVVGPLFSAFGPEAIKDRLEDSGAVMVITSPNLKERLDSVLPDLPAIRQVILVDRNQDYGHPLKSHELRYETLMSEASDQFEVPYTDPDDYSIIHYTSGTTGKPKGAVHRHAAVIAHAATTQYILDLKPEQDLYWCTADPGWVTGTSYGMFGPWALGASMLVYEGPFKAEDWYQLIQEHKVSVWYTAPTAIRMLMKAGEEVASQYDFSSLRHLCSVGEPLNPEAVVWGQKVLGHVFHDTWWQTETGAMHICNYPCMAVKPGSMGKPFPGVTAGILDDEFQLLPAGQEGHLAIRPQAPSLFQTYWNKEEMYHSKFKNNWYITGDRAKMDEEGYYWFIGRSDDVINTAGHLVGPFEVESALIEHPAVAEAGVIGKPDAERLEIVKAFISLKQGFEPSLHLEQEIKNFVRTRLAAHAYPREIEFLSGLPKTRSGKIMRRLLKARELGLPEGDTSTLEE